MATHLVPVPLISKVTQCIPAIRATDGGVGSSRRCCWQCERSLHAASTSASLLVAWQAQQGGLGMGLACVNGLRHGTVAWTWLGTLIGYLMITLMGSYGLQIACLSTYTVAMTSALGLRPRSGPTGYRSGAPAALGCQWPRRGHRAANSCRCCGRWRCAAAAAGSCGMLGADCVWAGGCRGNPKMLLLLLLAVVLASCAVCRKAASSVPPGCALEV